jgi:hypothetical protein
MLKTKKLLLVDGVSALISATSLGLLIPAFHSHFRVPLETFYLLAAIAVVFSFYSLSCYAFSGSKWRIFLGVIAIANLSYCVLTGWLIFAYLQDVSVQAMTYFIAEILLVVCLSIWELKVASQK